MGRLLLFLSDSSHRESNQVKSFTRKIHRRAHIEATFSMSPGGTKRSDTMYRTIKKSERDRGCAIVKPMDEKITLKTRTNNCESDPSSKSFVKTWMRRVLQKEVSSSKPDERSGLFRRRHRIRNTRTNVSKGKSSPTNSKTVTDETSSQYCHSRSEESPRRILLGEQLSFRDTVQSDKSNHGPIDDTRIHTIACEYSHNLCCSCNDIYEDEKNKNGYEKESDSSLFLMTHRSSDIEEEEKVNDDELPIVNNLFPMGYPNARPTENISDCEILNFVTKDDQRDTSKHLDSPFEKRYEETYQSPFRRSEVVNYLFPKGHPDDQKKKYNSEFAENDSTLLHVAIMRNTDKYSREEMADTINYGHEKDEFTESETSIDHDCDKFIGLVISFDPTWELLAPDETDHSTSMVKSRLKKFHEMENYADSLLGKFSGEESSEESTGLPADVNLSFETESLPFSPESILKESMTEEESCNNFHLGYHFNPKRFPLINSSEVEICFYPDEASIECLDEYTDTESRKTQRGAENLKFKEAFEFLFNSKESRYDVHFDEADSICSVGGTIFLDESIDCVDYECNMQSTIQPLVTTTKLHPLPSMSSPQQLFTSHNLHLFTDKDENEHTEYESASIARTQIITKRRREQLS
jgi:hypothetical protein